MRKKVHNFLFIFLKKLIWRVENRHLQFHLSPFRSSLPVVFCKKGVFKNFTKFTGKHLCLSLFFNKNTIKTLLKNRLWHRCFPVSFAKFLRTPFLIEHPRWLLLTIEFTIQQNYFSEILRKNSNPFDLNKGSSTFSKKRSQDLVINQATDNRLCILIFYFNL